MLGEPGAWLAFATLMVDVIVHWAHLTAAIVWMGGSLFLAFVLQPIARRALPPQDAVLGLTRDVGRRFLPIQLACLGVLVATGLFKLWQLREVPEVFHSAFGEILAAKLVFVLAVAVLAFLHAFVWGPQVMAAATSPDSPAYQAALRRLARWGRINLGLGVGIIFWAALLRYHPF